MANADLRAEPLTDSDRKLINRVLSNPLAFPVVFTQWLIAFLGPELRISQSQIVNTTVAIYVGTGDPNGTQSAGVGAIYLRQDGGPGTTLYVKEAGVDATGWVTRDSFTNGITISDGKDITIGGGTGSKIGSGASKLGFFGVAPHARPAATDEIKSALALLGLLTDGGASPLDLDGGKLTAGEINPTGDLNHDGTKVGFYSAAPVAKPSAYTQTFATTDKTLSAYAADNESAAYTGIDDTTPGTVYAQVDDLNALRTAYENLRALTEDLAKFVNAVVDDLQSLGLVG